MALPLDLLGPLVVAPARKATIALQDPPPPLNPFAAREAIHLQGPPSAQVVAVG